MASELDYMILMQNNGSKEVAKTLRKLADDIERNPFLSWKFDMCGLKPLTVSLGKSEEIITDEGMKNDYEISISIKDWSKPE